jgi:hypothetical protein
MNNSWDQWSPYWWQTATAAPALGVQPTEGWSESRSAWTPATAPSAANSGILGLLPQPPNESSSYPLPKATGLLGQLLRGARMVQATQNGSQTETEVGVSNHTTPAASRSSNMAHCLPSYVKCHDLHGGSMLRNGKRCGDCFNMCTLYGTWPSWYCPLY